MKTRIVTVLAALLCATTAAHAQTSAGTQKFYVGVQIGQSRLDRDDFNESVERDDDSTAYSLLVGYRFNRYFALEAGYAYLGEFSAKFPLFCPGGSGCASDNAETSVDGLVLNAIGIWPVSAHLSLKASLGLNYHDLNASLMHAGSETPTRFSANDTSFSAGLGIGVPINDHFELGLDLSRYQQLASDFTFEEEIGQVYETNATVLSLGARFRF